jgi:hypothetical protein
MSLRVRRLAMAVSLAEDAPAAGQLSGSTDGRPCAVPQRKLSPAHSKNL